MSDEGMGRPTEAWEEHIEAVPIVADRVIKWPYEPMEWWEVEQEIPLNARDMVIRWMRDMDNEQLSRVIIAAGILWYETSESTGMIACLYTACGMERSR
jgi:hypothetical protein